MLRLLQIAEILNLAHFVHALEKFLRDFRFSFATCSPALCLATPGSLGTLRSLRHC